MATEGATKGACGNLAVCVQDIRWPISCSRLHNHYYLTGPLRHKFRAQYRFVVFSPAMPTKQFPIPRTIPLVPASRLHQQVVLIVEDDRGLADVLREVLRVIPGITPVVAT